MAFTQAPQRTPGKAALGPGTEAWGKDRDSQTLISAPAVWPRQPSFFRPFLQGFPAFAAPAVCACVEAPGAAPAMVLPLGSLEQDLLKAGGDGARLKGSGWRAEVREAANGSPGRGLLCVFL